MIEHAGRPDENQSDGSRSFSAAGRQGFTGTVNLHLNDLIQMVCLSRSDLSIHVKSILGNGSILVREGEIQHAQTDSLQGEAAFFEIMRWRDGQFEMNHAQETATRSVNKPWEHLLLEAMRRRDEDTVEHHRAVLADFEENCLEDNEEGGLDEELDSVFDELARASREFTEEELEEFAHTPDPELKGFEVSSEETRILKVLVVDDSPFFSRQLKKMLEENSRIHVVATAKNGKEALDILDSHSDVDVITLDVEMPVMQGDTTLKHIMIRHPIPVITISSLQSDSLLKIFEFLQAGAVDFLPKPNAAANLASYGERLRDLVIKASRAEINHFRRWRKQKTEHQATEEDLATPMDRILVLVGAEGAHMDWFRLPLQRLCSKGIVLGLQKIPQAFLPRFCQLVEDGTAIRTKPLCDFAILEPGALYLANPSMTADFKLSHGGTILEVLPQYKHHGELPWEEGLANWLSGLANTAGQRLTLFCLSAATAMTPDLISHIIESGARIILSHRGNVMCTELIDSVHPYELLHPKQVVWGTPEDLVEVWLENEARS